jgi:hypothetical protein
MVFKYLAACAALVLLLMFLAPIIVKLKDVALGAVILIGVGLMALDLWESLHERDE